jgi:excisionase family DNA binding protein
MAPKSTQPATTARLLDVDQAAAYLGVSVWTVRSLIADKHLGTVKMPSVKHRGETTRRVLLDVHELDRCIERWRDA